MRMKIAVMGAGALGGYFGGRLQAAGHDVWLIARGAHLAAMQKRGLKIVSPLGDLHLPQVQATDDPAEVGPADVILFMVKNYDVEPAAEAIAPMIGSKTMVITCQNGVNAHQRLGAVIGPAHVVPGVARIPGDIPEPGVINHSADWNTLSFGEPGGSSSDRVLAFAEAMNAADGVAAQVPDNILHDLWLKFIGQSALSGLTTLAQSDIGPLRNDPAAAALFRDAMEETELVGRAEIPDLPQGLVEKVWRQIGTLPDTMHASMLDDLRAGKRLEVDWLSGEVVRLGEKHGLATPIQRVFWAALQPVRNGRPGA